MTGSAIVKGLPVTVLDRAVPVPPMNRCRSVAPAGPVVDAAATGRPDRPGSGPTLPEPPTDAERDSYLGPQQRWVVVVSAIGSALVTCSLVMLVAGQWWAWPFVAVVAVSTASSLLSMITSVRRRRDTLAGHLGRVARWAPERVPSVDVFLPSAGEDLATLENTYRHVAAMVWAGPLRVLVLDDSGRGEVRELADRYGFDYLSRPNRGHLKKAGNLAYAFDRSAGELVLILDADFVPRPDLLRHLVPYFDEPDVGIVQSPQFFDLDKRMNWVQLSAGATQVLFYRWIQPSWDRSGASICVGTNALYRRSALAAIGGFPAVDHSEDIYTGVRMLQRGFRTRYLPVVVAKGMCPDRLASFLGQQYRWAAGSMSLLREGAFYRQRMPLAQRASFWAGFSYYLDTALAVFLTAIPPILLAVLSPADIHPANYLFLLLALAVRAAVVPFISGGRDSLIGLARIQTAYSFAHAVAIADIARGRAISWRPTGAGAGTPTARRIQRLATGWLLAVQTLTWGLVIWRADEFGWPAFSVMAAFTLFQLVTVYPLMLGRDEFPGALDPHALRRRLPGLLGP